jgi:hypothetical protein
MASASSPVQIEGLEPFLKVLADLPAATAFNILKPALEEAGRMLSSQTRMYAYRVFREAESKGYKSKHPKHLHETAGVRVKMYRKGAQSGSGRGGTVFVAAGFKWPEGSYGHLVELGHRIVTGGTVGQPAVLGKWGQIIKPAQGPGISAAGKRWLNQQGWVKGKATMPGRGRSKKKWVTWRGAWVNMNTGQILEGKETTNRAFGRPIRGGGKIATDKGGANRMTTPRPMLSKAWADMKTPIAITLELEIKKGVEEQAAKLAQANGVKQ